MVPNADVIQYLHEWNKSYEEAVNESRFIEKLTFSGFTPSRELREAVVAFCVDTLGWDQPAGEAAYHHAVTRRAAWLKEQEDHAKAASLRAEARAVAEHLSTIADAEDVAPGAILAALGGVHNDMWTAIETISPSKQPIQPHELTDFGATKFFAIDFLGGLELPSPGVTIIGGKAASGKTTALVNAVRSLLQQGYSVGVFSYEQSAPDLALMLALSMTVESGITHAPIPEGVYSTHNTANGTGGYEKYRDSVGRTDTIFSSVFTHIKHDIQSGNIPEFLRPAYAQIGDYIRSGRLEMFDHFGPADALARRIESTALDVYVVDYAQVIPPSNNGAKDGYQRIAGVMGEFRRLASAHEKTVLLGAQFNRMPGDGDNPGEYTPDMEKFREGADIEHVASLALGLGWYPTNNGESSAHYWKILKHRYNGAVKGACMYSHGHFDMFYVYPRSQWAHSLGELKRFTDAPAHSAKRAKKKDDESEPKRRGRWETNVS